MIYIFSSNKTVIIRSLGISPGPAPKNSWVKILGDIPKDFRTEKGDAVYLNILGLPAAAEKKMIELFKKNSWVWGIIDPKGTADDPARYFFGGACDYIGPALVKKGLTKKRFISALAPRAGEKMKALGTKKIVAKKTSSVTGSITKFPAGKFSGWKSIREGENNYFLFVFISLSGKYNFRSLMGEASYTELKKKLREVLNKNFRDAGAFLWMETEDNYLFLVPPRAGNARAAVEAALKLVLNSRLIGMENLELTHPVDFTSAIHYGKTIFEAPGKTGTVISEAVNYIFHLGTKKAEKGRLTISGDVPNEAIPGPAAKPKHNSPPEGLKDFFSSAGIFEGIPIRHSKRFVFHG